MTKSTRIFKQKECICILLPTVFNIDSNFFSTSNFPITYLALFVIITTLPIVTFRLGNVYIKRLAIDVLFGYMILCENEFTVLTFLEEYKEREEFTYSNMEN